MIETCSLAQIAKLTGINAERIRYVIDQKLLPGLRNECSVGRGTPRIFTAVEAFAVACAAFMITAGLRRSTVAKCLDLLCTSRGNSRTIIADTPIYQALYKRDYDGA